MNVLIEQLKLAQTKNDVDTAKRKLSEVKEQVANYRELVASCQSPGFTAESERLSDLIEGL